MNLVSGAMETSFVGGDETSDESDKLIESESEDETLHDEESPAQNKGKAKKCIGDKSEGKKSFNPKLVASLHKKELK